MLTEDQEERDAGPYKGHTLFDFKLTKPSSSQKQRLTHTGGQARRSTPLKGESASARSIHGFVNSVYFCLVFESP